MLDLTPAPRIPFPIPAALRKWYYWAQDNKTTPYLLHSRLTRLSYTGDAARALFP